MPAPGRPGAQPRRVPGRSTTRPAILLPARPHAQTLQLAPQPPAAPRPTLALRPGTLRPGSDSRWKRSTQARRHPEQEQEEGASPPREDRVPLTPHPEPIPGHTDRAWGTRSPTLVADVPLASTTAPTPLLLCAGLRSTLAHPPTVAASTFPGSATPPSRGADAVSAVTDHALPLDDCAESRGVWGDRVQGYYGGRGQASAGSAPSASWAGLQGRPGRR